MTNRYTHFSSEAAERLVDRVIELCTWKPWETTPRMQWTGYQGTFETWLVTVADFAVRDQKGQVVHLGYDGAAANVQQGLVIHLTPGQAEKAFNIAEASLKKLST